MPFTFVVPDKDIDKYAAWWKEHKEVCTVKEVGAIGGRFTFSFTQTGLGCISVVKCACGEKLDLPDYESW